jgi:hypothetical protein
VNGSAFAQETATTQPAVNFEREIRPLLSNKCFQCHGPDAAARQADLRLDQKSGAFAARDDVTVIVPGDPAASELFRRISSDDPDVQMPPPDSDYERLTPEQIELIRLWIAEGAAWKEHWAFVPPTRPAAARCIRIGLAGQRHRLLHAREDA